MGHERLSDGPVQKGDKIRSRQIQLYGDRFVLNEGTQAAKQVKAFAERGSDFRPVGTAGDDGNFCVVQEFAGDPGSGAVRSQCAQVGSSKQGQSCGGRETVLKKVTSGARSHFHNVIANLFLLRLALKL